MLEKKRRDTMASLKHSIVLDCKEFWPTAITKISDQELCGLRTKKFQFLSEYGSGLVDCLLFNGLYVSVTDFYFKKDLQLSGIRTQEVLELSFLLEGEQIIRLADHAEDLIFESQECYLTYITKTTGTVLYHKNKRFKELKICLNQDFIKKHQLQEIYGFNEDYSFLAAQGRFFKPFCAKTQELLAELLSDKREGLLKRLFLESKVLELLTLQLDNSDTTTQKLPSEDYKIGKKLFEIQTIINSDLSKQFSIQELSRMVGLNDFMAKKEFKRIFGETIFEFALKQRMTKAKKLLLHTQKPIYEISELVGYKNATHFSAAFKKVVALTPKKYRNTAVD